MMGDEMAVRSGGMYGAPESQYTNATPTSAWGNFASKAGTYGSLVSAGADMYGTLQNYKYQQLAVEAQREALQKESQYNIENYQQYMADTLASNKMSFYSSGLDYGTGTASSVIASNQYAMQQDLDMMKYNYNQELKSLKNQEKANKRNMVAGMIKSVTSVF